jgi:hypothetical protein
MGSAEIISIATYILLSLGGGSAIVWSLSSFLGKLWSQRLLEDHRAILVQSINEHQIKLSRVFERQAEIISELYAQLQDLHEKIDQLHAYSQIDYKKQGSKKCMEFYNAASSTDAFFRRSRIFFSKSLSEEIESFLDLSRKSAGPYSASHFSIALTSNDGSTLDPRAELEKALPLLQTILRKLECEFRSLLGVKT